MRTTIRLNEALFKEAKRFAARNGRTLTAVIEDALRELLLRSKRTPRDHAPVNLPTSGEGGLAPGVDLDDSAALLDLMESES